MNFRAWLSWKLFWEMHACMVGWGNDIWCASTMTQKWRSFALRGTSPSSARIAATSTALATSATFISPGARPRRCLVAIRLSIIKSPGRLNRWWRKISSRWRATPWRKTRSKQLYCWPPKPGRRYTSHNYVNMYETDYRVFYFSPKDINELEGWNHQYLLVFQSCSKGNHREMGNAHMER